jgi:glycosyltransferase involved in cell wall biosynthesis
MSTHPGFRIFSGDLEAGKPAILLSSYGTGADVGKNLGVPGYSHDIVMQLYAPLLESWGKVIPVNNPHKNMEAAVVQAREQGFDPIHLSVIPCQDAYLSPNVPNVLMPAWEFPDIPDDSIGNNQQNDWSAVANQCDALMVSGPFTEKAFRKSGTSVPIHFVQVPTPETYFQVSDWQPEQKKTIHCRGYSFPRPKNAKPIIKVPLQRKKPAARGLKRVGKKLETVVRRALRFSLGEKAYKRLSNRVRQSKRGNVILPKPDLDKIELSGVVYTSIFNPNDGRKNWQDLVTSFLTAVGDKEDATLVVKLITRDPVAVARFLKYYAGRDIPHKCKLVVISQYLTEEQLCELAEASTYYIQTTRAEGNCLPLMNYLAAGRPGVSPCHSAIADYFDDEIGFVADSHPEPAAWPHDPQLRIRSTWARLVWPSMVEQIRESYRIAKTEPQMYQQISRRARAKLNSWASSANVQERLLTALDEIQTKQSDQTAVPMWFEQAPIASTVHQRAA